MAEFKIEKLVRKKCGFCGSYVATNSNKCERCEKLKKHFFPSPIPVSSHDSN